MSTRRWTPPSIDYESEYAAGRDPFGPPIHEFQRFFSGYAGAGKRVLDLGCGRGRDSILAARAGAHVTGVDKAGSGVAHMMAEARADNLIIEGIVADLLEFESEGFFDVVILGYVLHTLDDDGSRWGAAGLLKSASMAVAAGGFLLVSETPENTQIVSHVLQQSSDPVWSITLRSSNCVIAQRS